MGFAGYCEKCQEITRHARVKPYVCFICGTPIKEEIVRQMNERD